jgi:hypothetical protein
LSHVSHSSDLLVPTLNEEGLPPCSRVKDAKSLREIYVRLRQADRPAAEHRAEVQAMFDGQPPYDENELKATGQAFRCNLNFDEASSMLEASVGQYVDLLNAVENLATFKTTVGSQAQRAEWEPIMAEEFTKMLRSWPEFHYNYLLLAHHFIAHGVGIALFEDDVDWRWKVIGLGDFLMPRKTLASEQELEVAVARRSFQAQQLFRYIEDEETAKKAGWDVEATRRAIINAQPKQNGYGDWEQFQTEIKNNDLYHSYATASEVKVIHGWVQEFDGTVSHYLTLEDDSDDKENVFLYQCRSRFDSPSHAFVVFPYGIGTNGFFHSIRGLGHRIFPHIQVSNRLRSQLVDGSMLASSLLIVPQTEEALDSLAFSYYGPYAVLNPGFEIAERTVPDFSKNVLPVLDDMADIVSKKVGQYNVGESFAGSKERTRFEVQAQLSAQNRVSTASLNLFYEPWTRLLRSVVSRLVRRDYNVLEPGGRAVIEFRKRCLKRGVPSDAIHAVDVSSVKAVRAIGNGSEQMRTLALNEFTEMMGSLDDVGRKNLVRDRVAARIGYEAADRYAPKPTDNARPPVDMKIAELENAAMRTGSDVQVLPNDAHVVHARVHIGAMTDIAGAVEQGQVPVEQVIDFLSRCFAHTEPHVTEASKDGLVSEETAMLRKALQNLGEIVTNGVRQVQAAQRKAQRAQVQSEVSAPTAQSQQPAPPPLDPKLESKVNEHRLKLQLMQEAAQAKMQIQMAEARQKMNLKDAETASKIGTY